MEFDEAMRSRKMILFDYLICCVWTGGEEDGDRVVNRQRSFLELPHNKSQMSSYAGLPLADSNT